MRSLRWKILLVSVLIVLIPIYFLNRHALRSFDYFARTDLEQDLERYAYLVGEHYQHARRVDPPPRAAEFEQFLRSTAAKIGARIQVVSTNGVVLHDSSPVSQVGSNLLFRTEIAEAVTGAYSARARLTSDRQYMYFHIARPIKNAAKDTLAVAYLVRHTNPIVRALTRMMWDQRLAAALALAVAAVAATIVALTLTRRLRALTRAARRYADGTGPLETNIHGRDEIAELDRALHDMAAEITARNRYNREFVTTVLHELRSPLTAIRGAAEVVQEAGDPAVRQKFTGNILYQVERLTRLVGELRELTRLDGENRGERGGAVDYVGFVRDAVDRLTETFPSPRAELVLDLPAGALQVVMVPQRIEQVLANLLENAFRYTPPGGSVTVRVRPSDGGQVVTTVEDTGCGIQPADLPRVFDRFFTTERRDSPKDFGSGLGLAVVESIVRNHRGRIRVESEEGQGARFSFELPVA